MNAEQALLFTYLDTHAIPYTLYRHEPFFTCEQAKASIVKLNMPGMGVKNLFLKDSKKNFYLISAAYTASIDLKAVGKIIGAKELRFADAAMLKQYLGVMPGSVTPLALFLDADKMVRPIIDASLLIHPYIQIHPLKNDATVVIKSTDLLKFLDVLNRAYCIYDFEKHEMVNHVAQKIK